MPSAPSDKASVSATLPALPAAATPRAHAPAIDAEQVRLLYQNGPTSIAANLLVAAVVTFVLWPQAPAPLLIGWMLCHVLVTVGRMLLLRRYHACGIETPDPDVWGRRYTIATAGAGIIWGLGGFFLPPHVEFAYQVFLAFALGGMAVGSVAVNGSRMATYLAFMLPALIPMDLWMFSRAETTHVALATLGLGLMWALYMAARNLNANLSDSLRLAHERQELITSLRHSEHRYRVLYELNPSMYFTVGADDRVRSVNQFGASQLGYTPQELEGNPVAEVVHPSDRTMVTEMLAKCRDDPTHVHRGEFRKLRRDGGITWVRELARLVPSEDGTPLILLVCDDITERKEAEDQLRQHQEELAHMARVSTLGEMVSGIAHELNQPLSAIVNYAQGCARRLRAGEGNASTLAKAMEDIATQAHRGGEIIRHLRKMVRKGEKSERLVNVNELVRDVLRLNEGETRRSSTSVVLNLAADLPMVRCDPIQIEQVILNLMNNALEAMQCIDRANRWLGICSCIKEADCVEICIRDNGPGVRTDGGFEQMFAPFYTTKPHGMGMGLTISQSIAEAHGGKLAAQPRPEGGAAFCLTLPVCKPEPKQRF